MKDVNILIVDDKVETLKSLLTVLGKKYGIFTAEDEEEALEKMVQHSIDIAIINVRLPNMDGVSLFKSIKRVAPRVEVALMTSRADMRATIEAIHCGAYDYILKPVDVTKIEDLIEKGIKKIMSVAQQQPRKRIGEILVEKKIITEEELQKAVQEQKEAGGKLGSILIKHCLATEESSAKALSEQLNFPFVDLSTIQASPEAIRLISEETARKFEVIPLFKTGKALTVAMSDPLNVEAIDRISALVSLHVRPVIATPKAIKSAIGKYYQATTGEAVVTGSGQEVSQLMEKATQAPVINMVNQIIANALETRASDIHLEPEQDNFFCRLRIDGVLYDILPPPKELQAAIISRIKIMADMDIAEKRLPQDGRIKVEIKGNEVDLRISTFPTIHGENVSIRILDKSRGLLKLEDLGFLPDHLKRFNEIINKPYGIVLITGPTGCGKTTTLYAVLNTINTLQKNIITLEDPIEYTIPRIRQSQVNPKAGLTFASGLRSLVRQDPNVIMIGEIRDKETADIAVHSALVGHLVFSTLHTNDAPSAATRLIDIGVEPFLVSSSCVGVLAQRLVRRLCPHCKKKYEMTQEELVSFGLKQGTDASKVQAYKEVGCKRCDKIGFKGRIGIFELLILDENLKELISKKVATHVLQEAASKSGMKTLCQDGLEKVKLGITSASEILRVTQEV